MRRLLRRKGPSVYRDGYIQKNTSYVTVPHSHDTAMAKLALSLEFDTGLHAYFSSQIKKCPGCHLLTFFCGDFAGSRENKATTMTIVLLLGCCS